MNSQVKDSIQILTILFKIAIIVAIFCSGMYYADSNTECQISMRQNGDTHIIYGVKYHE